MESEIPRGGMGKESLAREVLRVDVQLGGHVTLRTYRGHLQVSCFFSTTGSRRRLRNTILSLL
jgi:hypothetical protein